MRSDPARLSLVRALACAAVIAGILATPCQAQKSRLVDVPGFVDSSVFVQLAGGEEAVTLEIAIHKSMIALTCAALEPELRDAICGLESINAVRVKIEGESTGARASEVIAGTEKRLFARGWERLAKVREEDADIRVLVLNDETSISGLVVMVLDRGEGELIFANVAGRLDLEAIQKFGDKMNIPGLGGLKDYR